MKEALLAPLSFLAPRPPLAPCWTCAGRRQFYCTCKPKEAPVADRRLILRARDAMRDALTLGLLSNQNADRVEAWRQIVADLTPAAGGGR